MPESTAEVARAYFDAFARRDAPGMVALWHEDGIDELTGVGIMRGPEEIGGFFAELFAALPDHEVVVERITADDQVAAVQWRSRATFSGAPLQGLEPTGEPFEQRGCDCLVVEDGLIRRNTGYVDGLETARSIGLLPPQDSALERGLYAAFNLRTRLRRALRER